jgi:integrase
MAVPHRAPAQCRALFDRARNQYAAWLMIRRRAAAAGITAPIGCHTFRATGITAYLANGGALEHALEMAAHESPRTTKLYDRTRERLTQGRGGEDQVMSGVAP